MQGLLPTRLVFSFVVLLASSSLIRLKIQWPVFFVCYLLPRTTSSLQFDSINSRLVFAYLNVEHGALYVSNQMIIP